MEEVSIAQVLEARERRAAQQRRMLETYGVPLISFTMNIAGPVKDTPLIRRGFLWGTEQLDAALCAARFPVLRREETAAATGCEAFYAADGPPEKLKELCVSIEEANPLGRLFDMDVLDARGRKLDRKTERRCIVCGAAGRACASRRVHSVAELQSATRGILTEHFRIADRKKAASLVTKALLDEVCTTPKPGLVDRGNNGSHRDMDIFTFMASAAALAPYWEECVEIGQETAGDAPDRTFRRLRKAGQAAERAMFSATGGINTHKGAIFTLGTVCGAVGRLWNAEDPCREPKRIAAECAVMCREAIAADWTAMSGENAHTAGERLYLRSGLMGVRGELSAGLPAVIETALPVLERALAEGRSKNDAGATALLYLIALGRDTNMAARSDPETADAVAGEVRALLKQTPLPSMGEISKLDDRFIRRNLSPGGCADLLAVAFFFHDWQSYGIAPFPLER